MDQPESADASHFAVKFVAKHAHLLPTTRTLDEWLVGNGPILAVIEKMNVDCTAHTDPNAKWGTALAGDIKAINAALAAHHHPPLQVVPADPVECNTFNRYIRASLQDVMAPNFSEAVDRMGYATAAMRLYLYLASRRH